MDPGPCTSPSCHRHRIQASWVAPGNQGARRHFILVKNCKAPSSTSNPRSHQEGKSGHKKHGARPLLQRGAEPKGTQVRRAKPKKNCPIPSAKMQNKLNSSTRFTSLRTNRNTRPLKHPKLLLGAGDRAAPILKGVLCATKGGLEKKA